MDPSPIIWIGGILVILVVFGSKKGRELLRNLGRAQGEIKMGAQEAEADAKAAAKKLEEVGTGK